MKSRQKLTPLKSVPESPQFNLEHFAGHFDLSFLEPKEDIAALYEYELQTAKEKADYYEHLVKNNGHENSAKIAKDCRKRAKKYKEIANKMDSTDEALPLTRRALRLENLAHQLENPYEPENDLGEKGTEASFLPDGENAVNNEGLPNLVPLKKPNETDVAVENVNPNKWLNCERKRNFGGRFINGKAGNRQHFIFVNQQSRLIGQRRYSCAPRKIQMPSSFFPQKPVFQCNGCWILRAWVKRMQPKLPSNSLRNLCAL